MPSPIDPAEENFDTANAQLNDGLKSCRAVVSNYRALLAGDADDGGSQAGFGESAEDDERAAN